MVKEELSEHFEHVALGSEERGVLVAEASWNGLNVPYFLSLDLDLILGLDVMLVDLKIS